MNIELYTKSDLKNIGWTLSSECRTIDNGNYGANRVYPEKCDLVVGQSYTLRCKSGREDGWYSSFVIIESKGYCDDFTDGREKVYNVTITGIYVK